MRTFHALVYDQLQASSEVLYVDPTFHDMLGSMDELSIVGVARSMGTPGGNLTVQLEESPDQIHWVAKGTPIINAVSLVSVTMLSGRDTGAEPPSAFVRIKITHTASSIVMVSLWATVRAD